MSISFNKALAALALSLAACTAHEKTVAPEKITAATDTVQLSVVPETRITTGTVRSSTVSPLSAKVMGNVTRVLVSEGDRVTRGQVLVEIDARDIQAKVAQAQAGSRGVDEAIASANAAVAGASANADFAATTLRRFTALRERGSISPHEFDEVSAKAAGAQAELERAKKMRDQLVAQRVQSHAGVTEAETFLSYATVRSPIDGVVTARMIDPGAQAAPGMPLVTVEDPASRRVETTVDEELAARLRVGDQVVIPSRGDGEGSGRALVGNRLPDASLPLGMTVARVANIATVDPQTRSAFVKIDLPHESPLRSGTFVHVRFTTGTRNALTIPSSAIATRGQLTLVFVVDTDGTARMRLITPGETFGDRTEVLSGLDADEHIVSSATAARDGVLIASAKPGAAL